MQRFPRSDLGASALFLEKLAGRWLKAHREASQAQHPFRVSPAPKSLLKAVPGDAWRKGQPREDFLPPPPSLLLVGAVPFLLDHRCWVIRGCGHLDEVRAPSEGSWPGRGWLPHRPAFSPSLQDPFVAFHINKGLVRKYMHSLLIGELSPEQPSFEPTKNVSCCWGPCACGGRGRRWFLGIPASPESVGHRPKGAGSLGPVVLTRPPS